MLLAQIILLCIQCFNLLAIISCGVSMAINNYKFNKRQEEYRKRYYEIMGVEYGKEKKSNEE